MANLPETKPTLYATHQVPFDRLEPEPFATFVHGALEQIGKRKGWQDFAQPDIGADGGFDSSARRTSDNLLVCIQCKRSQKISVPEVGTELAKVALNSVLEGSKVGTHLVVVAGRVSQVLRRALREPTPDTLTSKAIDLATNDKAFRVLRQKAADAGIDVAKTVAGYVGAVTLIVWSGNEFDGQLGQVFSQLSNLIERTFVVHPLVREHARPDFAEEEYLKGLLTAPTKRALDLYVRHGNPPNNVRQQGCGDPLATQPMRPQSDDMVRVSEILDRLSPGSWNLLVGPGGSGKSTSSKVLVALQAERRVATADTWMPVYIDLGGYVGDLSRCIDNRLKLKHGSWTGMPGRFLLVLDGLDIVPRQHLGGLANELADVISRRNVAVLLTCRPAGPSERFVAPTLEATWLLRPCSPRHAWQLADQELPMDQIAPFCAAWFQRAHTDEFVTRPQGLAGCVRLFRDNGALPGRRREVLEALLPFREMAERDREAALPDQLSGVPFDTLCAIGGKIALDLWLLGRTSRFGQSQLNKAVQQALKWAKRDTLFGADTLDERATLRLLVHCGIVVDHDEGSFGFEHDSFAGLLAAAHLARKWRRLTDTLKDHHGDDAWILAASRIEKADQPEFVDTVAAEDPVLAVRCVIEMGEPELIEDRIVDLALIAKTRVQLGMAMIALRLLGTADCLDLLRTVATTSPERSLASIFAKRALARLGDPEVLADALQQVDRYTAASVKVSGGEVALWETAPPTAAVRVARQRIQTTKNTPLAGTIEALAQWGTDEDVNRIADVLLQPGQTLMSFIRGLHSLHNRDPIRGRDVLKDAIDAETSLDRVYLYDLADSLGYNIDSQWLADRLVQPISELTSPETENTDSTYTAWFLVVEQAAKLLCKHPLPEKTVQTLVDAFDEAGDDQRGLIWRVAREHRIEVFDPIAREILLSGEGDVALAARYAAVRTWDDALEVIASLKKSLSTPGKFSPWIEVNLVELMLAWNQVDFGTSIVRDRVLELVRAWVAQSDQPDEEEGTRRAQLELEMRLSRWNDLLQRLAPQLSESDIRQILRVDAMSFGGNVPSWVVALAERLNEADLDRCIRDAPRDMQIYLLQCACHRGPTQTRLAVFQEAVTMMLNNPSPQTAVLQAADALWSDQVLSIIVEVFATEPWPENGNDQWAESLVLAVAPRLTQEQRETIVKLALDRTTEPTGRRVLEFLYELSSRAL